MNKKNIVATFVALAVLVGVWVIYYAGQRALHYIGPSKLLTGPNGTLFVVSHGKIHQFSPAGVRVSVLDLRDFGRELTPSDMAMYRDGRFLVGEASEPAVYRCDPLTKSCERFSLAIGTFGHIPGNSVKFFLDELAGRIYLSDNAGHRVLITDLDGRQLNQHEKSASRFWFPNQLWREADGKLVVVNTNYKKIVAVDVTGDQIGKELWSMSTRAATMARPGRGWPFSAVHSADGSWWVLNARDGMRDADLVHFAKNGSPIQRVDLGAGSDPFGVVLWNERLLIADAIQYRIQTVGGNGSVGEDFGDTEFRGELAEARNALDRWRMVRLIAQGCVVFLPLVGIFLIWRLGEPASLSAVPLPPIQMPENAESHTIERGEIAWLVGSLGVQRKLFFLIALLGVAIVLLTMALIFLSSAANRLPTYFLSKEGVIYALAIVIFVNVIRTSVGVPRAGYPRLGCDGVRVFYEPNATWRFSAPVGDVLVSPWAIRVGKSYVLLRLYLLGEVFPRIGVEKTILSQLPASVFVRNWKLQVAVVRVIGVGGWLLLALLLVVFLFPMIRQVVGR